MGMFDTIRFENPFICTKCGREIKSTQTKVFECALDIFTIGDCVSHAEDTHIIKEWLYCDHCKGNDQRQYVYFAVKHGILLGITEMVPEAERLINGHGYEKLVFMYFNQYKKRILAESDEQRTLRYIYDVIDWFADETTHSHDSIGFIFNKDLLQASLNPIEALQKYLKARKKDKDDITE